MVLGSALACVHHTDAFLHSSPFFCLQEEVVRLVIHVYTCTYVRMYVCIYTHIVHILFDMWYVCTVYEVVLHVM